MELLIERVLAGMAARAEVKGEQREVPVVDAVDEVGSDVVDGEGLELEHAEGVGPLVRDVELAPLSSVGVVGNEPLVQSAVAVPLATVVDTSGSDEEYVDAQSRQYGKKGAKIDWADEVSCSAECSAVQMPDKVLGEQVRQLNFGSGSESSDSKEPEVAGVVASSSDAGGCEAFFSVYVRTPQAAALNDFLWKNCGIHVGKAAREEMALVTYTTATMPVGFRDGCLRYRGLSAIGDAALTLVVVEAEVRAGQAVASMQWIRSSRLSNGNMIKSCVASGLSGLISYGVGVDPSVSKTSADALEAVAGVLQKHYGVDAVVRYARLMQFLSERKKKNKKKETIRILI